MAAGPSVSLMPQLAGGIVVADRVGAVHGLPGLADSRFAVQYALVLGLDVRPGLSIVRQ